MSRPKCPKCGATLHANREEYEWYCPNYETFIDHLGWVCGPCSHYFQSMTRAIFNDLKQMAREYQAPNGEPVKTREEFAESTIIPETARRAWDAVHRKAKG